MEALTYQILSKRDLIKKFTLTPSQNGKFSITLKDIQVYDFVVLDITSGTLSTGKDLCPPHQDLSYTWDFIFPIWNISEPIKVKGGGHLAIYEKPLRPSIRFWMKYCNFAGWKN